MKAENPRMSGETKAGTGGGSSSITVIITDPDVLKCNICTKPLFPPIFQCANGHIECSSCSAKLGNKCHSCALPIGNNRCLAIEKVIESIKLPCQHAEYGCGKALNYNQRSEHEEACIYGPCVCPIADCVFLGSSEQLSFHFSTKHSTSARCFRYNCPFSVCFDKNEPFIVLQGEEDGRLFLLNNRREHIGNSIMVTCIGISSSDGEFLYNLMSRRGCSSLRFQSFTKCVKGLHEAAACFADFHLVPSDFCFCTGQLKMEVCIRGSK